MKGKSLIICLFLGVIGFSSCEKSKTSYVEEIGYGTSFGMCIGYCINDISIATNNIKFTKKKNGTKPDAKTCTKTLTETELNSLKAMVVTADFEKLPEVIGCPDCADGGAEWVALKLDGKMKKVTFEYGSAPNELKNIVVKLREIKEGFSTCN